MYIGGDIGGTKTLVAVLDEHGKIVEQVKFPTPKNYDHWLLELRNTAIHMKHQTFKGGAVASPGYIDRKHGRIVRQPNLPWKNEPLQADCEKTFHCPIVIENDANLAALSEAMLHLKVDSVLYVTISTGIGTGFVYKQQLDPALLNGEGGQILLAHKDSYTTWEKLSAGRILYEHFGKPVSEIPASDTEAWSYIARHIAMGLQNNIAIMQPELIIIGGSVGKYFDNYGKLLQAELERYKLPVVKIPKVIEAKRPDECVIYGCYDLAKQKFGHD